MLTLGTRVFLKNDIENTRKAMYRIFILKKV